MRIMNEDIVIFGGSGFIGSRLCSLLDSESFKILDKREGESFPSQTKVVNIRDLNNVVENTVGATLLRSCCIIDHKSYCCTV